VIRWPFGILRPRPAKRHVEYVPAHPLCLPLVNPNGGHPGFFMMVMLPVISAGAFGRVEPESILTDVVHESRN
jgi:hypothetical protein